jgi:hypothetical protein
MHPEIVQTDRYIRSLDRTGVRLEQHLVVPDFHVDLHFCALSQPPSFTRGAAAL